MNYLTTAQAADLLNIHRSSVHRTLTKNGITPMKINPQLNAWPREAVEQFAETYDPMRGVKNEGWTAAACWGSQTTREEHAKNVRRRNLRKVMLKLRGLT